MKGPSLSRSFRPVWLQFKVLTRGWHKHPVQQLTRVRTNSLKILPTKYKIRLPANCAQVNCLISFKYELDRPSSLRTSAQITWIRLGCWDAQSLCVSLPSQRSDKTCHWCEEARVESVSCVLASLQLTLQDTPLPFPVRHVRFWNNPWKKYPAHVYQSFIFLWLFRGLSQNNAVGWQSGRKINL